MIKVLVLASLILIGSAQIALAENQNNQGNQPGHPRVTANEMAAAGAGAAFLVGAAGYLLLRRRKAA